MFTVNTRHDALYCQSPTIVKRAAEDAVLFTTNKAGEAVPVPVSKGSIINIRTRSVHEHRALKSFGYFTALISFVCSWLLERTSKIHAEKVYGRLLP